MKKVSFFGAIATMFAPSPFKGKTDNEIVQMIHNDFDKAEDELLDQANAVLKELNIQTQREFIETANLASRLGFVNIPSVKKAVNLTTEAAMSQAKADVVLHYKQRYPFQKFLTEDQLHTICKKYGLVHAPIERYTQDVPVKNLKEIAAAPELHERDRKEYTEYIIKYLEVRETVPKKIRRILKQGIRLQTANDYRGRKEKIPDYAVDSRVKDALEKQHGITYEGSLRRGGDKVEITEIVREGLFIAAPASHFNLEGLDVTGEFGYATGVKTISFTEVKDPVVFRYVKDGIQVLSKWGLEASDELLQNPIEN